MSVRVWVWNAREPKLSLSRFSLLFWLDVSSSHFVKFFDTLSHFDIAHWIHTMLMIFFAINLFALERDFNASCSQFDGSTFFSLCLATTTQNILFFFFHLTFFAWNMIPKHFRLICFRLVWFGFCFSVYDSAIKSTTNSAISKTLILDSFSALANKNWIHGFCSFTGTRTKMSRHKNWCFIEEWREKENLALNNIEFPKANKWNYQFVVR